MRRRMLGLFAAGIGIAAPVSGSVAPAYASHAPDYTRRVTRPFKAVVAAVEEAARINGFQVSGHHNVAASIRKAGLKHEPYLVIEVCNAKIAEGVLAVEPRLGALMPCRIAVYEDSGSTVVTTALPSRLAALYHNERAVKLARVVDHDLRLIVQEAVR